MDKSIKIRFSFEKKSHVLSHPQMYVDTPLICIRPSEDNMRAMRAFFSQLEDSEKGKFEAFIRPVPSDPTKRAHNFFFLLRDRLAESMGDISREHKYSLYKECVRDMQFYDDTGGLKDSIRLLTRKELWQMTEHMMDWLAEADVNTDNFTEEYNELREELNEDSGG